MLSLLLLLTQHCLADALTRCVETFTTITRPKPVEDDKEEETLKKDTIDESSQVLRDQISHLAEGDSEKDSKGTSEQTITSSDIPLDASASKLEKSKSSQKKTVLTLREIAEAAKVASMDKGNEVIPKDETKEAEEKLKVDQDEGDR